MGACDDEKEIYDKEKADHDKAEREFNDALNTYVNANVAASKADANLARCGDEHYFAHLLGSCSGEEAAASSAGSDEAAALADFEREAEQMEEAQFWLDVAADLYCDCLVAHPEEG